MSRYSQCMAVVFAVLVVAASTPSHGTPAGKKQTPKDAGVARQGSVIAVGREVSRISGDIAVLEAQSRALDEKLQLTKSQVEVGLATLSDVDPLEVEAKQVRERLSQRMQDLIEVRRLVALAQPVDIVLKSASIRQAAEVLSRVSGVKITVDASVPKNVSVRAQARSVALGAVIEVIADAAHLTISPANDGGLLLRRAGKLVIDGKAINYQGDNWPWSDEWISAARGGQYLPMGRRWLRLFENAQYLFSTPAAGPTTGQGFKGLIE